MTKITEWVVANRIKVHLKRLDLLPQFQSAYRQNYLTETGPLHILSEVLEVVDQEKVTTLMVLDLSSAFDCVDHKILLSRIDLKLEIRDKALSWNKSYVTDRSSRTLYEEVISGPVKKRCGVLQGSILGPLLIVMFLSELEDVVLKHHLKTQFYADDILIYNSHYPDQAVEAGKVLTNA